MHHSSTASDDRRSSIPISALRSPFANSRHGTQALPAHTPQIAERSGSRRPQDSHSRWTTEYLQNLRNARASRPEGARPIPSSKRRPEDVRLGPIPERASSALGTQGELSKADPDMPERSASALSQRLENLHSAGRSLATPPLGREDSAGTVQRGGSRTLQSPPVPKYKIPYYERGQRWMERQEMSSLRYALEEKDLQEEQRIYESAQDEAAGLVWKHQNPGVPYKNPDQPDYKAHLRKGSHARSQSIGPFETLYITKAGYTEGIRSASDGSNSNHSERSVSNGSQQSGGSESSKGTRRGRYPSLSFSVRSRKLFRRGSNNMRNAIGEPKAKAAGGIGSQIYEEPDDVAETIQDDSVPLPLKLKPRNTSYGSRNTKRSNEKGKVSSNNPGQTEKTFIVDIHKNPPSQSRNASYRRNPAPSIGAERDVTSKEDPEVPSKDGKEIRSDDIRAATSMRFKERNSKLPSPAVVSDLPGRPIVSFDEDWKPRVKNLVRESSTSTSKNMTESEPQPTLSTPTVPLIHVADGCDPIACSSRTAPATSLSSSPPTPLPRETPSTEVSVEAPTIAAESAIPTISLPSTESSSRPLPVPGKNPPSYGRPLPTHPTAAPTKSLPHWTAGPHRAQAQCAACALPISGRVVSAASQRFHPQCFTCFHCGEQLECVAFYPEPEAKRSERLARIEARLDGGSIPADQAHHTETDDGDGSFRFYCHLDFHERFSPRCRSCKTPIEGQVILACGGEWHVGHFFCAECGDPFEQDTPFVEKDGFAWCVGCHTKRYSGKCAACRKPITDLVVNALGKEWHEACFCCTVSLSSNNFLYLRKYRSLIAFDIGVQRPIRRWSLLHQRR